MAEYNDKTPKKKKLEKVVTGPVRVKKKSEAGKVASMFISDSVENIKSYIVMDVIVPTIQDTIINILEMVFHGRARGSRKGSYISYNSIYDSGRRSSRSASKTTTNPLSVDELRYGTRGDAENVLDIMFDIIDKYGVISISDVYDMSDVSTYDYTLTNYGWTDLYGSKVKRTRDGYYILDLPKARPLK